MDDASTYCKSPHGEFRGYLRYRRLEPGLDVLRTTGGASGGLVDGGSALCVGVTAAMFTMVPMFASLGFGRWLDRTGTLWPMAFAASLAVIAALVFTLTPHLFALPVVAGLAGAGACLRTWPPLRRSALSRMSRSGHVTWVTWFWGTHCSSSPGR